MSNIWIMTRKELRSYFDSSSTYIFMVLFLVLCGTYVVGNIFLENTASLRLLFEVAPILMLLFVPAVTMRLISGEKREGTFELLGTQPIRVGDIVLGKFFASWILVVSTLTPTAMYAVVLSTCGRLDWGPVAGGFCGLFLLGGSFVAIGLFASALSDNQVISLIVGSILVSCVFFVGRLLPFLPYGLVAPVEYLSAEHHFSNFGRGILDSRDVVYGSSLIIVFLLLATMATLREYGQSLRDLARVLLRGQGLRLVLVCTVLLLANMVSMMVFFRVDLTEGDVYTLSNETKSTLMTLDDELVVRAYLTPDLPPPYHNYRRDVQDLLEEYRVYSRGKFHYGFVATVDSTGTAQEATAEGISPITLTVLKNDKIQTVNAYAGLAFSYADRFESLPMISSIDWLEYDLTSAMKRLKVRSLPTIGLVAGHGSPGQELMRSFLDRLAEHYHVKSVTLSDSNASLANVVAVLIIGPRLPFSQEEKVVIDRYIMNGGRVAFFVDGMKPDEQNRIAKKLDLDLDNMFDTYGWCIDADLVVDKRCDGVEIDNIGGNIVQKRYDPNPFFPVVDLGRSNESLAARLPVVLPYVSSIDIRLAGARGIEASIVRSSSSHSARLMGDSIDINPSHANEGVMFGEEHIPLAATFEGSFKSVFSQPEEKNGPLFSGALSTSSRTKSVRTKIAVVGDGDFVLDGVLRGYQNTMFAVSLVDWLVNETGLSSLRTRKVALPSLDQMREDTRIRLKCLAFGSPPALVIVFGLARMGMKSSRRGGKGKRT